MANAEYFDVKADKSKLEEMLSFSKGQTGCSGHRRGRQGVGSATAGREGCSAGRGPVLADCGLRIANAEWIHKMHDAR